ncbi:hypothetical protein [Anaplasma phagocytophilum]|nr:hypothetical protein [Anaplasma phagocytophilum]
MFTEQVFITKYHVYFIGTYYEINQEKSLGVVPYACGIYSQLRL